MRWAAEVSPLNRPNILLLYTDQQRWDALGAAGNAEIKTPNLDRLAAGGLNFARFFVQNPVCMPSRVSMLTGRYPSALGITRNGVPVPPDALTLPRILRNYGYYSANIGKLHFLPHANRDHRQVHPDYGFDHLEISDEPGCYEDAYRAWVRRKAPDQLDGISVGLPPATEVWQKQMGVRDGIRHPPERFPIRAIPFAARSDLTHSAFVAEQTMEFLRGRRDGRPFFCIAGFYSPHSPWVAPREFLELYDPASFSIEPYPASLQADRAKRQCTEAELRAARHGYYAMVSEVDLHVGRILECLVQAGLAEDTIVVFTSDHGEWLGEHLRYGKGYPATDAISRVPLLVRWPAGVAAPGRTIDGICEAVDLVPTLLEWIGVPTPPALQGRSFAPLARAEAWSGRTSALIEGDYWKALRTAGHHYVLKAGGEEHLYDLAADPRAYRDLAGEPVSTPILVDLRLELARRLIEMERYADRTWAY